MFWILNRPRFFVLTAAGILVAWRLGAVPADTKSWVPEIPKAWDDAAVASMEIPLTYAPGSPVHVPSEEYYRMKVRTIYRSYPIYHPSKEPPGYWEWLQKQEPEIIFDISQLRTKEDWIRAGEMVFDGPTGVGAPIRIEETRAPAWYEATRMPLTSSGIMPFYRYVIRTKGKVEMGANFCGTCHTRVMRDGSLLKGTQGNFPFDRSSAFRMRARFSEDMARRFEKSFFGVPWLDFDNIDRLSRDQIIERHEAIPPGVAARDRTSSRYPVVVGDLIGLADRKYLDRTGLVQHRSLADVMRYSASVLDMDMQASFDGFIPNDGFGGPQRELERYSDEQLYALTLYLYSLKPPQNPNRFDSTAARGEKVFQRENCAACHTPPLYTNNKLTPAEGFTIPEDHQKKYDILPVSVGTDPGLAMKTRKGTGYYKVPSLKGVWYRGPFEHNGSVATLEDWFDPRRLRDDYVPTGFKGYGIQTRAVKGHEFGLKLSVDDKRALIAFLKTL
jgi:hypothetical protein